VAAAHIDPLWHFLAAGASEGRLPFAPAELFALNGFDFVYYLTGNPDVAAAGVDPLWHFQTIGWKEGRNPNALFDTAGYLSAYTDIAAAQINPLDHYNQFGWHEGRDPSVGFDTTAVFERQPGRRRGQHQSAPALPFRGRSRRPLAASGWHLGLRTASAGLQRRGMPWRCGSRIP
jgi:hypothetical protein